MKTTGPSSYETSRTKDTIIKRILDMPKNKIIIFLKIFLKNKEFAAISEF